MLLYALCVRVCVCACMSLCVHECVCVPSLPYIVPMIVLCQHVIYNVRIFLI